MICFYHRGDLDGHASGAIVRHHFVKAQMVGLDYEDTFPWEIVEPEQTVVMVDFSLPMADMARLKALAAPLEFIWIDHHHTAIAKAQEARFHCPGRQVVGNAACELTWRYFFPLKPMPLAVFLLGRYDVWDESQDNWLGQILPFQYGMRSYQTEPSKIESIHLWHKVIPQIDSRFLDKICDVGSRILQYQQFENAKLMAQYGFLSHLGGLRALVVNNGPGGSMKFEGASHEHFPIEDFPLMISFARVPGSKWRVNLYTFREDVDCGEIARRYGGGGHRKAAGFICDELPFKI